MRRRVLLVLIFILILPAPLRLKAQQPPAAPAPGGAPVMLKGAVQVGDQWRTAIEMQLEGQIAYRAGDKTTTVNLKAKAEHKLDERVLKAAEGQPTQMARFYHQAQADIEHHNTKLQRTLRPERRLLAARQTADGTQVWRPGGPLTREELDLCGGHADVLAMHHLLPNKEVAVGGEWHVPILAAQALALVEGVVENKMTAKLEKVEKGVATLSVAGTLDGIQQGGEVKLEFRALIEYSLAEKRFLRADWRTRAKKMPGPIAPERAVLFESATKVVWSYAGSSKELPDAVVAQIPAEPSAAELLLQYRDGKERFSFLYERNWHQAALSDEQLVLRCLERGELLGQMNLRPWKPAAPGQHLDPGELRPMATQAPGFTLDQISEEGTVPAAPGYWIYRLTALGRAGDLPLQQTTLVVAGPRGDQCLLMFSCEVQQAMKFAGKDLAIAKAIEFPAVAQTGGRAP